MHAGCAGCHVIALDVEGQAWLFGRNTSSALGVSGVDVISENAPWKLRAQDLGAAAGTKFVHAACGRAHSILVGSDGRVWTAGVNLLGQVSFKVFKVWVSEYSWSKRADFLYGKKERCWV